jgi:hypothetical protein
MHDGLADSQNIEESYRIFWFDRLLPQVCSELWKNKTPLNELTKKDTFSWTPEETQDFEKIKEAM